MATVLLSRSTNTFCGVYMSVDFGTLTLRSVHPASPVLLTKNGPLGTTIDRVGSLEKLTHLTYLKFENRLRKFLPQGL